MSVKKYTWYDCIMVKSISYPKQLNNYFDGKFCLIYSIQVFITLSKYFEA
jgi:hypothetical protein